MKILKETECDGYFDLEIELTEDEELTALTIGKKLLPNEENDDILIQAALEYFIVLGFINDDKKIQK